MSNIITVKCKKEITRESILEIFSELNAAKFKNILVFNEEFKKNWDILGASTSDEFNGTNLRSCWMKSKKTFEMNHRGSPFPWACWMAYVIKHTVAKKFDGVVIDESDGIKEPADPEKYPTFTSYLNMSMEWYNFDKNSDKYKDYMKIITIHTPAEFHNELPK